MRSSVLALLLAGCSLRNVDPTPCTASVECRDAFGFGSVCGDAGYCETIEPSNRCAQPYPADLYTRPELYADAIVLGALFDYEANLENLRSIELAVDEANIEGGLNGRTFALASCNYAEDIALDPDDTETAANALTVWLADEVGVQVILGPGSSPKVEQIWNTASARDLLLVAPSATSDRLVAIDGETSTDADPGLFWRTAPPDQYQAGAIAADLAERGVTSVAIVHQTGAYGEGLADGILAALPGSVATEVYPYANSNQLTAAIADAGNSAAPEVVYISSDPDEIASFLNGAAATGDYDAKGIFLTDAARDQLVLDAATNAEALFDNLRGSVPVPDPSVAGGLADTFFLAYSQRYGVDAARDAFNPFAYDAAWITLYGHAWAAGQEADLSGVSVARGLRQLSSGPPELPIRAASWPDAVTRLSAGQSIDVFGASGTLDFDPVTAETQNPIAIWTVGGSAPDWVFVNELLCQPNGVCAPFP